MRARSYRERAAASEIRVKATGVASLVERGPCGCIGQVGHPAPLGKSHALAAMDFPDVAEHQQDGFGQGEKTFLVTLTDDSQNHLLRVDRGDRQGDGL